MSFCKKNHIIHVYLHIKSNYFKIQLWLMCIWVKTRFNMQIILNISFHGPIQNPILFYLSTFGIQCIFLTNQQGAYETRVGVSDWIAGGEVQVGNTGRVTFRRSLPQLPPVGERFTWLNLISFPFYTYSTFKDIYLSRAEQTFCWHKLTRWCKQVSPS